MLLPPLDAAGDEEALRIGSEAISYRRLRDAAATVARVAAMNLLDRSNVTISGLNGGLDPSTPRVGVVSGAYGRLARRAFIELARRG